MLNVYFGVVSQHYYHQSDLKNHIFPLLRSFSSVRSDSHTSVLGAFSVCYRRICTSMGPIVYRRFPTALFEMLYQAKPTRQRSYFLLPASTIEPGIFGLLNEHTTHYTTTAVYHYYFLLCYTIANTVASGLGINTDRYIINCTLRKL